MTSKFNMPFSGRLKVRGVPDGVDPLVRTTMQAMREKAAELAANADLSDTGRARVRTAAVVPHLRRLNEEQQAIRAKRLALTEEAATLFKERAPVAATESEVTQALRVWDRAEALEARGQLDEARRVRAIFTTSDPDAATARLMAGLLGVHPAALGGPMGEQFQQAARTRLGLNPEQQLGKRGQELADAAEDLAEAEKQIRAARAQLIAAADRATLEAEGVILRKASQWSSEERAEFIDKHGPAAYRELLDDELREAVSIPASTRVEGFELPEPPAPEAPKPPVVDVTSPPPLAA